MYRIPPDLDLSAVENQSTTQFCVGAYDLQFSLGSVHFSIQSRVELYDGDSLIGRWEPEKWPSDTFFRLYNAIAAQAAAANDRELVIRFKDGLSMHIYDDSEQYESFQIRIAGEGAAWVI